ncbi:hypothetical protein C8J56DRAFT_853905 [Mycena floridula]|nr:hypothetical protein C8J56DRAFT_853905 [Mycena floridula]
MSHWKHVLPCSAKTVLLTCLALLLALSFQLFTQVQLFSHSPNSHLHRYSLVEKCKNLHSPAGPPSGFDPSSRLSGTSDRFVPGTPPILIRNGKILTGARNGTEIVFGDVFLDKGLVVAVGYIPENMLNEAQSHGELQIVDAHGKWISPGLVDLHSHIGVGSAPSLSGARDGNSRNAPILPWLRSIDGLNTHDASYELSISGGVTVAQVLPGSANNIGGQAVLIKLRSPADRSVSSRVLEAPRGMFTNTTKENYIPWRHMKHACGENPRRVYSETRLDAAWNFRKAYKQALDIKNAQDEFCAKVELAHSSGSWGQVDAFIWDQSADQGKFPEDLQWEALVDVLRGRVKVSVHCYEAVDLDMIVRLTNEFKFPVASFHHAGETYLVPDTLKKAWGGTPSIALFAANARKKREAYRGSEFAPSILAQHGIPVVMKSDHPVLNSRYLIYEAQQAHFYGLHPGLSLASVTSTPAAAAGVGHRVGKLAPGYDADLVIWDSHPLALGATPVQVYIDGIAQLSSPHISEKPSTFQEVPQTPNWDKERNATVDWDGLPPLRPKVINKVVKFVGVRSVWTKDISGESIISAFDRDHVALETETSDTGDWTVVVSDGKIACFARDDSCASIASIASMTIDLKGGSIAPGLTSFGSDIGLSEIELEPSTNDGPVFDPLLEKVPSLLKNTPIRAVDGLQFDGRNLLLAYRAGVTRAVSVPQGSGLFHGIGTTVRLGAMNALEKGAIIEAETAIHIAVNPNMKPSVSTQIAALRELLLAEEPSSPAWGRVREGQMVLVVTVQSLDIMATLISLKHEYENVTRKSLLMTFSGASEAHLLAEEIAEADISVILTASRPFPHTWDKRRILPGPPLTYHTGITALLEKKVNVAIGVEKAFDARNARFDIAWAALESSGRIGKAQAIALASTSLEKALGLVKSHHNSDIEDLVVYEGGDILDMSSKVVAVISGHHQAVEMF